MFRANNTAYFSLLLRGGYAQAGCSSRLWGARDNAGSVDNDWLGAPMYFSHYDAKANIQLVERAGLRIASAREETADEDGIPSTFLWVVARKS